MPPRKRPQPAVDPAAAAPNLPDVSSSRGFSRFLMCTRRSVLTDPKQISQSAKSQGLDVAQKRKRLAQLRQPAHPTQSTETGDQRDQRDDQAHPRKPKKVDPFDALLEPFYYNKSLTDPINTARDKWNLLPAFLKVKGLVKQHIDSYNYFVEVQMKKIVHASSTIRSEVDHNFYIKYVCLCSL